MPTCYAKKPVKVVLAEHMQSPAKMKFYCSKREGEWILCSI